MGIVLVDEKKRSFLSEQLKQQLKNKRMIFPKRELELSGTVGQGTDVIFAPNYNAVGCICIGEAGLVYKGYLDTAIGKEIVAVKTGKGMY